MPADDLVLNVKQIAGYSAAASALANDALLLQRGGLGGPYLSISPAALVSTALSNGGDMSVAGTLSAQTFNGGVASLSNAAIGILSAQKACVTDFSAAAGAINGVPIATSADIAALAANSVQSFEGRQGAVCLWIQDIIRAGGAPNFSPAFGGCPRAPTPQPGSNSSRLATTAFVAMSIDALTMDFAPIDSPAFTGVPTAPTAALGSSDGQLATTAFVQNAVTASTTGVSSFNTRTGAVVLTASDITAAGGAVLASPAFTGTPTAPTPAPADSSTRIATTAFVMSGAGFAPIASPTFTGIPNAPTPTPGTNTTQLATTAFVVNAIGAINSGVVSFNGRQGAVNLIANDISAAGGALLASPAFTGTPTAPTPPPGDNSTRIATTAFIATSSGFAPLASPAFTGVPTAPTATLGTNTLQLATTAFVQAAIAGSTAGVSTFNGRTGAVTLQANDLTAAGGALLASPAFTGTPSAPTAALGTNTTQLATTAYVMAAASTTTPLMNGTAAVGTGTTWARSNHVHPIDTSRAAASALANYLPLAGGTMTGLLTVGGNGISYGSSAFKFTWDGTFLQCLVDGANPILSNNIILSMAGNGSTPLWGIGLQGSESLMVGYFSGGSATWTINLSDRRFKANVGLSTKDALAAILGLNVYEVDLNPPFPEAKTQHWNWSLMADELDAIPSAGVPASDQTGYATVRDLPLIAALIKAVQQLTARLEALETRMAT